VSKARKRHRAVRWARYLNHYEPATLALSGTCIRRMYAVSDEAWLRLRRQR